MEILKLIRSGGRLANQLLALLPARLFRCSVGSIP
jgi:hypothetical protein